MVLKIRCTVPVRCLSSKKPLSCPLFRRSTPQQPRSIFSRCSHSPERNQNDQIALNQTIRVFAEMSGKQKPIVNHHNFPSPHSCKKFIYVLVNLNQFLYDQKLEDVIAQLTAAEKITESSKTKQCPTIKTGCTLKK